MSKIDALSLLSNKPVKYGTLCTLTPPRLDAIREVGYTTYMSYINCCSMELNTFLEAIGIDKKYGELSEEEKAECTVFNLLIAEQSMRVLLHEALSFFIEEKVVFEGVEFSLYKADSDVPFSSINSDNFDELRDGILQLNYLSSQGVAPMKFKNARAKAIYEKCQMGKKKMEEKTKGDINLNLPNVIASISTQHNSYNLLNIWDLTVYQLYDQFIRLNTKVNFDINSLKWAAWGSDPFEASLWYKDIHLNN